MEFFEVVANRRSIRKFADRPVEKEKIDQIIDAALRAPSARNTRSSELIVVTDPQVLSQLSLARPAGSGFIKNAPLAVVVYGDTAKSDLCIENASITAVYIQLATQALGLGSCWSQMRCRTNSEGQSSGEYISNVLGVPKNLEIECIIAIGYPDEEKAPYHRDELPLNVVHQEKY